MFLKIINLACKYVINGFFSDDLFQSLYIIVMVFGNYICVYICGNICIL